MTYPSYLAAWHTDKEVLRASTSGGAFTALAQPVLESGGIVVGAAYDQDLNVRHEIVETMAGLSRLRGVKYVHGEMGKDIFKGIAAALAVKRRVLFTGLPCQAAAVRQWFGKTEGLVIVDLICFGAPPMKLWRKYVDMLEQRRGVKLTYIDPRDKAKGWGGKTYYRYEWADGKVMRKLSLYDPYAQAFYRAIAFGKGCFRCPFKGISSRADITIGDCNGYKAMSFSPEQIRNGISCVIVRTAVGEDSLKSASLEMLPVSEETMTRGNKPIVQSANEPSEWAAFNSDLRSMSFEALIAKYHLQNSRFRHLVSTIKGNLLSLIRMGFRCGMKYLKDFSS